MRHHPVFGSYPWLVTSTVMVNHYYVYAVDEDFGPFFPKFCSYFPYNAKLCINGHEHLTRQLTKEGIAFKALDNGIAGCAVLPRNLRPRPAPRHVRRIRVPPRSASRLNRAVDSFDSEVQRLWEGRQLAA